MYTFWKPKQDRILLNTEYYLIELGVRDYIKEVNLGMDKQKLVHTIHSFTHIFALVVEDNN